MKWTQLLEEKTTVVDLPPNSEYWGDESGGKYTMLYKSHAKEVAEAAYKEGQAAPAERFKMPNDKQIIGLAILYNDGKVDKEQITNMVALCQFTLDRLYENGDILIPSSKEEQ